MYAQPLLHPYLGLFNVPVLAKRQYVLQLTQANHMLISRNKYMATGTVNLSFQMMEEVFVLLRGISEIFIIYFYEDLGM